MSAVQRERRSQAPYCSRYASAAALISGVTYGVPSAFWMRWPASKISFTLAMANTGSRIRLRRPSPRTCRNPLVFHAVHAQYQADDLDVRLGLSFGMTSRTAVPAVITSSTKRDLHAVPQAACRPSCPPIAMVLLLLAVEGAADLHAMGGRQRDGGGHAQRDALV